jgi:hypothetical protein
MPKTASQYQKEDDGEYSRAARKVGKRRKKWSAPKGWQQEKREDAHHAALRRFRCVRRCKRRIF